MPQLEKSTASDASRLLARATVLKPLPMFGFTIPRHADVKIAEKYQDAHGNWLATIRYGWMECYGVDMRSLAEKPEGMPF